MSGWVFILLLTLPSSDGEVLTIGRASTYAACEQMRQRFVDQAAEPGFMGSLTRCALVVPPLPAESPQGDR